ncbi:TPA: 30S ribosomal protein S13 [Candidatus Woesearchaeota archaeon]|nr:30S ribosomal protein S13 [Candidatus Woesearchaeota archaeon]
MADKQTIKALVRIANTDIEGRTPIYKGLTQIRGVSFMLSHAICRLGGIPLEIQAGTLDEQQMAKLDEIIKDPLRAGVPSWMANRRKDPESGEDKHLTRGQQNFATENDLKMMMKTKSYKGIRHHAGKPVRGQRTKSNFRKNKGKASIGVKKRPTVKAGKA